MTDSIHSLATVALADILPVSINGDAQILAVADALDTEAHTIVDAVNDHLPYLPNLDNQASRIVDLLAWQFHVDNYDPEASIAARRQRVRQAIAEHKVHGTRGMVAQELDAVFGEGNYTLIEWWEEEPVRAPYTFRVLISTEFTAAQVADARRRLEVVSSVRSHWIVGVTWNDLDLLEYSWDDVDALGISWLEFDAFYLFVVV